VCGACRTVSVREGQDLSAYGTVGEIQEDSSVIQVGTEGVFESRRFEVLGRLQVTYKDGFWNEWHVGFSNGTFGWLVEAQGHFSVMRSVASPPPGKVFSQYRVNQDVGINGQALYVSGIGHANVIGGEGSLPFPVASGWKLPFVDLSSEGDFCGTLDFSDDPEGNAPRLFLGKWVNAASLELKGLRVPENELQHGLAGPTAVAQALRCPNCGGGLERLTGRQAASIHCQYCGSAIDTQTEPYTVYAANASPKGRIGDLLELGDSGIVEGHNFKVIAILEREAVRWSFRFVEYLLYHPLAGYRWLIESDRHYTWMKMVPNGPFRYFEHECTIDGETLDTIDSGRVVVRRVVGELYWRVKVGDQVSAIDYASPPYAATYEASEGESTWSFGEYVSGDDIAKAFNKRSPSAPRTVAPSQPNPYSASLKAVAKRWGIGLLSLIVGYALVSLVHKPTLLGSKKVELERPSAQVVKKLRSKTNKDVLAWRDRHTVFLGPLEITADVTMLELQFSAPDSKLKHIMNFTCSLYDQERSESRDFNTYDLIVDPGGLSTNRKTTIQIPSVKKGQYYLRLEPFIYGMADKNVMNERIKRLNYEVKIYSGVLANDAIILAFYAISVPVIFLLWLRYGFEKRREEDA
jgi:hypothetical protein